MSRLLRVWTHGARRRRLRPQTSLSAVAGFLALLGFADLVAAPSAQAHAFLIASNPAPGTRLSASPSELRLTFSEPFVGESARVAVQRVGGDPVSLPAPSAPGTILRQPLPSSLRGVFLVSWRVLADDGHESEGKFAFAVGKGGKIPAVSKGSQQSGLPSQIAISLLAFLLPLLGIGVFLGARALIRRTRKRARDAR